MLSATVHQRVPSELDAFNDEIVTRQRIPRMRAHPCGSKLGDGQLDGDGRSHSAIAALGAYGRGLGEQLLVVVDSVPLPDSKRSDSEAKGGDDTHCIHPHPLPLRGRLPGTT